MEGTALIAADSTFTLWSVLFALAALGFWADNTRIGKQVSGVGVLMIAALLLSNLGVIPRSAPAYGVIFDYLVPLAIPLLLLKANLRRVIPETGPMLVAYAFGAAGTLVGALVGFALLPLGDWAAEISGAMAATYIGGSMNFIAVGAMLGIEDSVMASGVAADNVAGTAYLVLLAVMSSNALLRRWLPSPIADETGSMEVSSGASFTGGAAINLGHIALSLAISLAICAAGSWLAAAAGLDSFAILFITGLALIAANLLHTRLEQLSGHLEVGMLLMYTFFVVIGVGADLGAMISSAGWVFLLAVLILAFHLAFILSAGKLFGLDLAEVLIASNGCAAGPSTAAALAASRGWHQLVSPGVLCGTLGYAIASFLGVMLAGLLRKTELIRCLAL